MLLYRKQGRHKSTTTIQSHVHTAPSVVRLTEIERGRCPPGAGKEAAQPLVKGKGFWRLG